MTDFQKWYTMIKPEKIPALDPILIGLQQAYEAGAASQAKILRDEFAGQAMIGWMSAADHDDYLDLKFVTSLSYEFADAMLEARKTTGEGEA
jgi:hypothetical protein